MINVPITIDKKDFEKKLGEFSYKMPSIARTLMNRVNTQIKKDVRKELKTRKYNTKSEKSIYKNIYSKSKKDFTAYIGVKNEAYHSRFIEHGAFIKSKDGSFLTFQINGEWKKVKSVTLEPKPFLEPVIKNYWDTEKANKIMEEAFDKIVDKLFGEYK